MTRRPADEEQRLRDRGDELGYDIGPGDGGWYAVDIFASGPVRLIWARTPAELGALISADWETR